VKGKPEGKPKSEGKPKGEGKPKESKAKAEVKTSLKELNPWPSYIQVSHR
jgi:hypothetical protein